MREVDCLILFGVGSVIYSGGGGGEFLLYRPLIIKIINICLIVIRGQHIYSEMKITFHVQEK
jgi:hypothetical protein